MKKNHAVISSDKDGKWTQIQGKATKAGADRAAAKAAKERPDQTHTVVSKKGR